MLADNKNNIEVQREFAQHVLNVMNTPKGQKTFDFSSDDINWYKRAEKFKNFFIRSLPYA